VQNYLRGLFLGSLLGALITALFVREKPRKSRTVEQIAPKAMQYPQDFIDAEDEYRWLHTFIKEAMQEDLTEREAINIGDKITNHVGSIYTTQLLNFKRKINKLGYSLEVADG
jgi:hypothetical protein